MSMMLYLYKDLHLCVIFLKEKPTNRLYIQVESFLFWCTIKHIDCTYKATTSVSSTSGTGTAYPSGAPGIIPGFLWCSCYSIFSFMCNVS